MDKHLHNNDWFLIINPAASSGKVKKKWHEIKKLFLSNQIEFEYSFTEYPMHAIEIVENAVKKGHRNFIGVGGDGTNNEIINGLLKQKEVPSYELLYTLFPLGTGNDWIKTHGIPKNPKKWFDAMTTASIKQHDAGLVLFEQNEVMTSRFFVNVAGLAYDAFVLKNAMEAEISLDNQWDYLMGVVRCLFKFKPRPIRLKKDETQTEEVYFTINIGICKYSGGGMQLVPHAQYDSGQLALMTAKDITPFSIILNFPKLYGGRIKNYDKALLEKVDSVLIEAAVNTPPTYIEVDGELIGQAPAEFSVLKGALRVLVP